MIKLAANLSDPLIALIAEGQAPIDLIEVGPWFSIQQIRSYQNRLSEYQFLFHGSNQISRIGLVPGATRELRSYLDVTESPWLSLHLNLLPPGAFWLAQYHNLRVPLPPMHWSVRRFLKKVDHLVNSLEVPVLLENMPVLPIHGYEFEAKPDTIHDILLKSDCKLLLDIAHARIAATALDMNIQAYLCQLPLPLTTAVHLSGCRIHNGRLVDAHEPLEDIDYDILQWVLNKTKLQVVTLEYFREREALHKQLALLRGILKESDGEQTP